MRVLQRDAVGADFGPELDRATTPRDERVALDGLQHGVVVDLGLCTVTLRDGHLDVLERPRLFGVLIRENRHLAVEDSRHDYLRDAIVRISNASSDAT